jgi:hypothetical protein
MAAKQVAGHEFRIALLDDRKASRDTVIRGLGSLLPSGWVLIPCPLLENREEYPKWLINNRVLVLLVDQLLNEEPTESGLPVHYKGNDVIETIRHQLPDFPIIVVTRAVEDVDLDRHLGEADGVVGRTELLRSTKQYVIRIVRLGRAYLSQFEKELASLATLAQKKATGEATTADVQELNAVQAKLGLVASRQSERDDALSTLEREITNLEHLGDRVKAFLAAHKPEGKRARQRPPKRKR